MHSDQKTTFRDNTIKPETPHNIAMQPSFNTLPFSDKHGYCVKYGDFIMKYIELMNAENALYAYYLWTYRIALHMNVNNGDEYRFSREQREVIKTLERMAVAAEDDVEKWENLVEKHFKLFLQSIFEDPQDAEFENMLELQAMYHNPNWKDLDEFLSKYPRELYKANTLWQRITKKSGPLVTGDQKHCGKQSDVFADFLKFFFIQVFRMFGIL